MAAALCTLGCSNGADKTSSPPTAASGGVHKGKSMKEMEPRAPRTFEDGHALTPAASLIDWLGKNATADGGGRALFRVPVVIVFKDAFRMSISKAFIGTSVDDSGGDKVAIDFDDTAMGVGLFDRLGTMLGPKDLSCAVWLEAHWGPQLKDRNLPIPPGANPDAHVLAVRSVGALITDGAPNAKVQLAK